MQPSYDYSVDINSVFITILGSVAGILVQVSFIPQILRAYKRKKMEDVSIFLMVLIGTGMFLWVIYGIYKNDVAIYLSNIAGVTFNIILIIMKKKYSQHTTTGESKFET